MGEMGEECRSLGNHFLLDLQGIDSEILDDIEYLKTLLLEAAHEAKVTVLGTLEHKFHPQGATVLILLSESHISIHSWPELNSACIDFFTCGSKDNAELGIQYILKKLHPHNYKLKSCDREIPATYTTCLV